MPTVTPGLDIDWLLADLLDVTRTWLHAHGEATLSAEQLDRFTQRIDRRRAGEPVAYILGHAGFWDADFVVSPAVLIPRPETEQLIELVLASVPQHAALTIADIGTGSGAIAVILKRQRPACTVFGCDISQDALQLASHNAARLDADVHLLQGDLAQPLLDCGLRADVLVANLPYIPAAQVPQLEVSRYEPGLALDGGDDGLDLVRRLLHQVPLVCRDGASVWLEIGHDQGDAVGHLMQHHARQQRPHHP